MIEIVRGMIFLWFGTLFDIPAGYVLCNGANGTPDLRNRFVVGAGGSHNPGDTGGSENHDHEFTGSGHFHNLSAGGNIAGGLSLNNTTDSASATGTTDPTSTLPPYHALVYIMKT